MKDRKTGAIILAGGRGERMKNRLAKQFMPLANEPIIIHTLRKFELCPQVDDIVLVLPLPNLEDGKKLINEFSSKKLLKLVAGGERRQDSLYQALSVLDIEEYDVLVVHDGVRPLVQKETISKVIALAREKGAAITAIPAVNTIKEVTSERRVRLTLDRSRLMMVQTPQAFWAEILLKAMDEAKRAGFYSTDESGLVERLGVQIYIVEGSPNNIKITNEADLRIAEAILKEGL